MNIILYIYLYIVCTYRGRSMKSPTTGGGPDSRFLNLVRINCLAVLPKLANKNSRQSSLLKFEFQFLGSSNHNNPFLLQSHDFLNYNVFDVDLLHQVQWIHHNDDLELRFFRYSRCFELPLESQTSWESEWDFCPSEWENKTGVTCRSRLAGYHFVAKVTTDVIIDVSRLASFSERSQ